MKRQIYKMKQKGFDDINISAESNERAIELSNMMYKKEYKKSKLYLDDVFISNIDGKIQKSKKSNPKRKKRVKKDPRNRITVHTDGSCVFGTGGCAAIISHHGQIIKQVAQYYKNTTSNRMELMACILALNNIEKHKDVFVYSDSQYVVNGISSWIDIWMGNNWKRGTVKNIDLWKKLYSLKNKFRSCSFKWIRGHNGNFRNELADDLSKQYGKGTDYLIDLEKKEEIAFEVNNIEEYTLKHSNSSEIIFNAKTPEEAKELALNKYYENGDAMLFNVYEIIGKIEEGNFV